MPRQDDAAGHSDDPGCGDPFSGTQGQDLAADDPADAWGHDDGDGDQCVAQAGPECGHHRQGEDEQRERQQAVHDTHEQ